jgi:mRNA interferase RelE/StbE
MFEVEAKKKALKILKTFSEERKDKIKEVITVLKNDPVPFRKFDVVKLKGYEDVYRIRIGDLRIIYGINWDRRRILVHFIGPREKAYERS